MVVQWTLPVDVLDPWIGQKPDVSDAAVTSWILKAEREIRREFPDMQVRIESGDEPDLEDTIRDVVSAMVTRVLRNPEGYRQMSRTDGNITASATVGGDTPGELRLTTKEYDSLVPPDNERPRKAFTIQPRARMRVGRF